MDSDLTGFDASIKKLKVGLQSSLDKMNDVVFEHASMIGPKQAFINPVPFAIVGNFSGLNFSIPMKIRGELMRAGEYYTGKISGGELKKAYDKLISTKKSLLLFSTHNAYWQDSTNANDVLGKIYNFGWDNLNNAITYEGEILDENNARKVFSKLVEGVSAGFLFQTDARGYNFDIDIKEATLTFKPACKTAYVSVSA